MFHKTAHNGQLVSFSTVDNRIEEIIQGTPKRTLKLAKMVMLQGL